MFSIILITRMTKIELFTMQDVITKQFDLNSNFYFIKEGSVEILKEFKDFGFYDHEQTKEYMKNDPKYKFKKIMKWMNYKEKLIYLIE